MKKAKDRFSFKPADTQSQKQDLLYGFLLILKNVQKSQLKKIEKPALKFNDAKRSWLTIEEINFLSKYTIMGAVPTPYGWFLKPKDLLYKSQFEWLVKTFVDRLDRLV